jgi:hypothetical protein
MNLPLSRLPVVCVLLIAAGALALAQPCVSPPAGLVAWWPAEGNANDAADGHHGTANAGVSFTAGRVGQAFRFDGGGGRVNVPDNAAFKLTNSLTIEGWIYIQAFSGAILFIRGDNRPGLDPYTLSLDGAGRLYFRIGNPQGGVDLIAPIAAGQWKHVAGVLDGATGEATLYLDGAVAVRTNTTQRPMAELDPGSQPAIGIGNHGGTTHNFPFNGLIDELSLYSRALSESEVRAIYDAGAAGKCPPVTPPSCVPAPAALISWWPAEGDAQDIVDNNHGALRNGATFAPGKVGQAFNLDGVNDYVEVPNSASLNPPGSFTIDAWIYPRADGNQSIVQKFADFNELFNQRSYVFMTVPGRALRFGISDVARQWDNPFHNFDTDPGVLTLNTWNFVAAVYDQSTGARRIYVNGVKVKERVDPPITVLNGLAPVGIGVALRGGGVIQQYFNGLIDEVELVNRALSDSEIRGIFNAGEAGKCRPSRCTPSPAGLVAWWPGENNANDAASGHHGTANAGVSFTAGRVSQAFRFDGAGGRVHVPDSAAFQLTEALTIEGWINVTAFTSPGFILFRGDNRPGLDPYALYVDGSGRLNFHVGNETGALDFGAPIPPGQWKHVAAVLDGAANALRLYVDGALVAETNSTQRPMRELDGSAEPAIGIGNHGGTTHNFPFNGLIDEISLYARALSGGEIQAIFNAGSGGKCPTNVPPTITSQPQSLMVFEGQTATFSVVASGTPSLRYQWRRNGDPVPAGTEPTLVLTDVQLGQAGDYSVEVSNAGGSVLSSNAVLMVKPRPPCTAPSSGLVAWWPAEGSAADIIGGYNGSMLGGVAFTESGRAGISIYGRQGPCAGRRSLQAHGGAHH